MSERQGIADSVETMRAFARMLPLVPRHESIACATWMLEIARYPKTVTFDELPLAGDIEYASWTLDPVVWLALP